VILALSVVAPNGSNIRSGTKTIEVRSWRIEELPIKNLLIVENSVYLSRQRPVDANGCAVALVDVESIHERQPDEVEAACATEWQAGFWAWCLSNVRPIAANIRVAARRKLYSVDVGAEILGYLE
jgi:hypothetical protein